MNKQRFTFPCVVASLCLFSFRVQAAEVGIPQCPATINVLQEADSSVTDGWKIARNEYAKKGEYRLARVDLSAGEYAVEQTGFEIPSEEKETQKGEVIVYHDYIVPSEGGMHDYWLVCSYHDTSAVLVRKLPENVRHCEVSYPNDPPDTISFRCSDNPRKDIMER